MDIRAMIVVQELIFQATIRGKRNWIRFPRNSDFHLMIGQGKISGVGLEMVRDLGGDMMEIST